MEGKWSLSGWLKAAKSADGLRNRLPAEYKTRVLYSHNPFSFYICAIIPNKLYDQLNNSQPYIWTDEIENKPEFLPNSIGEYKIRLLPIGNN